jgi:hypothetical protein
MRSRCVLLALALVSTGVGWSPGAVRAGESLVEAATSLIVAQHDLVGGPGSEAFGNEVVVLANGNYVVVDPGWDSPTAVDVGAVYLYDGATDTVISTLTGSTASDRLGSYGIVALTTGNYIVSSPSWKFRGVEVGAVTFGNGTTGVSGPVTTNNSLHGTTAGDRVGEDGSLGGGGGAGGGILGGVAALTNGNYLVSTPYWDHGGIANVGAVTFGNGTTGISGPVTTNNSLHGTTAGDHVGSEWPVALANGNYLVTSPSWDHGGIANVGAVTFGNGTTGISGPVTTNNSLHGTTANDHFGDPWGGGLVALANGNYLVSTPYWDHGGIANVGAVTFGNGTTGISGPVTTNNSLHGTTANDYVGRDVVVLTNGNYVITSSDWDHGGIANVGAVTFGNGTTGISGPVTTNNSLHGTTTGSGPGGEGVVALTNGNYVVASPTWDLGPILDVGAATFGNGTTGVSGPVTTGNSLHGTTADDHVGAQVVALTNGNYVVGSSDWDHDGVIDVGAVTFGNGTTGVSGPVTTNNSLHGTTAGDQVGSRSAALTNGNYVVRTPSWDHAGIANVGAATFGNGTTGVSGPVTTSNSLHGTTTNDWVGSDVDALTNGNYVVRTPYWDHAGIANVGAATFGDGTTGVSGPVTTNNSLHGTTTNDRVGHEWVAALTNGNYVVRTPSWDHAGIANVGAVTFGDGTTGVSGPVTTDNSLHGTTATDHVGGGGGGVEALTNGKYVVTSPYWDHEGIVDAGAVTLGDAFRGVSGAVTSSNSVIGTPPGQVRMPGTRLTSGNALPVPTTQNRVLMIDDNMIGPNGQVCFAVAGSPGDAAIVNLTPVEARGAGYGLLISSDIATPPIAANVNYQPGTIDPNVAVAPIGADGKVCYVNSKHTSVNLVADHLGTIAAASYTPATQDGAPDRKVDTRIAKGGTTVSPSGRLCFAVAGSPGDAAIVNLTPVEARGAGYGLLISSDIATPPIAANVNYQPGTIDPNVAVAPIGADGKVCYVNSKHTSVNLVADHLGTIAAASYTPATQDGAPDRKVDTRIG